MKYFQLLFSVIPLTFLFSCEKNDNSKLPLHPPQLPKEAYDYESIFEKGPQWFIDTVIATGNPVSNNGATLGRVLFYDPKLSLTNAVSCGSCHHAVYGFGDSKSLSTGFLFEQTMRNSMPIINPAIENFFFWDNRVQELEIMVLNPVQNHVEMGMENLEQLTTKLTKVEYYPGLFAKAFGTNEITQDRIASALAQFLRSMVSVSSKYDKGAESNFSNFTAAENEGRNLFFNVLPCGDCHDKNNLGGFGVHANIGLDADYADNGIMDLTGNSSQEGDFKIPSLRNVGLSSPYMHDGRFVTLEDVVRFYNSEIAANPNLSFPLDASAQVITDHGYGNTATVVIQTSSTVPVSLDLTDQQISDIVAFLNTLTDESFVSDIKFSDPFAY